MFQIRIQQPIENESLPRTITEFALIVRASVADPLSKSMWIRIEMASWIQIRFVIRIPDPVPSK